MATAKFKDASPYTKPQPTPPPQDYLHQKYVKDITLKNEARHKIIKLALFGVGRAGTIHLSNVVANPRVKLLYVIDDVESKWEAIRQHWHLDDVTFLNSKQSDKVYSDPKCESGNLLLTTDHYPWLHSVDTVVVASPTYTHETIVRKALEAKKAVFCEKPVAEDRVNTMKCYETAKKVGKPLFSAFNRRFDPSYSSVRERVRKGEVGHVHTIKTVSRDSPLPTLDYLKMSGGIFHDCMVHDLDMITWVLGEYPVKVAVHASANIPEIKQIGDFDTVAVSLYFPSGTLGMIDLSRNSNYGYDQRLEVFGPKGMIRADNEQPMHGVSTQYGLQGPNSSPIWYSFPSRFMNGYRRELDHFVDVVLGMDESSVLAKETLAVSKLATACEESARSGKMVEIKWAVNELPEVV